MHKLLATLTALLLCSAICFAQDPRDDDEYLKKKKRAVTATASWSTTSKTCLGTGGASAATISCTWSTNPAIGESVFCTAGDYSGSALTYSVTDSNSDTYSSTGSRFPYVASGNNVNVQLFWFPKLTVSISTTPFNL